MTKKWKTIRCSQSVFDRLDFISKVLNRNKSAFLEELFTELFDLFNEFESANIMYTSHSGKLIINAYGKSIVSVGMRPVEPEIAEIEEKAKPIISKFPCKGEK